MPSVPAFARLMLVVSTAGAAAGCAAHPLGREQAASPGSTPVAESQPHMLLAEAAPDPSPPAPPPPAREDTRSHEEAGRRSSNQPGRTAGWFVFSVGADAAVLAIITSFMMLHEKDVRDANCDANKACKQPGIVANDTIGSLAWWNTSAWVLAGAGLGVGAILLITNPPGTSAGTAITVAPTGSGAGLNVRSTF